MLFEYIRPVPTCVDLFRDQFIAWITVHESLQPRLEGRQVRFNEEMSTRAEVVVKFGRKETGIGPKVEDVDGRGFAQVGRHSLKNIGCATATSQYVCFGQS
jgi:hypothetical protein